MDSMKHKGIPKKGLSCYNYLMSKFHIHTLSSRRYGHTVLWSIFLCVAIVCATAMLGRAAHNFKAALTDAPDVAIYLLLPDEKLGNTTLLHANKEDTERAYLAETATGPKLIKIRKNKEWMIDLIEPLHDGSTATGSQVQETEAQQ